MPKEKLEKIEQNLELVDKIINTSKKVIISFKGLIFSALITGGALWYAWEHKEIFIKEGFKTFIHKEVVEETSHYAGSKLREKDSLFIAGINSKVVIATSTAFRNKKRIEELEERMAMVESMVEGIEKRGDYNTKALHNIVVALCEQMDEAHNCSLNYYKSHTKQNWVKIHKDSYDIDMIYPFSSRGCKGYYTDINTGSTIEIP